ncbi:ATP-binding protein [Paenibacillus sp. 32352]|uniref:hybrid sensor histidine kinase/response regulator n=1 Tax=Paenibacillus sp. 32352 TaxID=1969111 RepID=UPI0009AE1603|nr:ATP-binding protein [Paenibacillus sp. 32352]
MKTINARTSIRYGVILILFLSFLLGLRLAWNQAFLTLSEPRPDHGVLDLRGFNLDQTASFLLDGEWEFYPNQLLTSQDIRTGSNQAAAIQVPGDWGSLLDDESGSSYGYGTYRLRILIDPLKQPVALWFQGIQASSAIELNGVTVGGMGNPAANPNDYVPWNVSYTSTYSIEGTTEIELLIRAANFDDPHSGGILKSFRFGSQASIDYVRWYSIGFQLVIFLILLLHGLYAIILFIFNRHERALLITGLLTVSVGIAVLAGHDNVLLLWLPVNYAWAIKLRLLALLWQNVFILLLFRKFAAAPPGNLGLRIYLAAVAIYSGFLVVAPASWVHTATYYQVFHVYYLLAFAWFIYIVGTMIFKKQADKDIIFLMLTAVAILSNVTWSLIEAVSNVTTVYYPLDILAAITGFSTYWFKKYFRKSSENAKLNEQLKRADKLKDQFLANTSHELRTPLHGIMNIARTVVTKEKDNLNGSSLKDMELLITISNRMSHMLGDLLDVAQLQEQRLTLSKEPLLVQSVVPGVIGMLSFMTGTKPIQLHMDISEKLPPVMADEKRLVQILYNLLHNAIKYTEQGIISVSADMREGRAILHVSDTGIGMDEETQARIFLPYEQGAYGVSDRGGIGLGLSICKQLVELHGGTLSVRSQLGEGSVFSFDLPITDEMNSPLQQDIQQSVPEAAGFVNTGAPFADSIGELAASVIIPSIVNSKSIHILAVDDDPINLSVLEGILSAESYNITTVHSAREALELLETKQWDLLITDVMMPHTSGYELTQKVRERYSVSDLPILLLTARTQPADIYTGFMAGANDYITKPVDSTELKYRIRALTALKQSIDERLRIEAAYLQAQIHPHFLFNTLSALMALSDIDTEKMRKLGDAFASFLRISFDYLNTDELVELEHELELVKSYLYIEQERFGERLSIQWEVDPNIEGLLLPPLSIQPLIENAVIHGLLSRNLGGTVRLSISRQENLAFIEVQDNGKGMDQERAAQLLNPSSNARRGIGISNTHRRLTQLYGHGLSIVSRINEGTTVSFVIPDSGKPLEAGKDQ